METPDLSPDQRAALVTQAATALFAWQKVGNASQIAHARLLMAWALARTGDGATATHLAGQAWDVLKDGALWERAFALAARAAAADAANDPEYPARHAQAARAGAALSEDEAQMFRASFDRIRVP